MTPTPTLNPAEARAKILAGHDRFRAGELSFGSGTGPERREALKGGQAPYASVLTCSDSRVSPEHIFDAGLGDLFVCRNAGHVLDETTLGSLEFAAAFTGCPLILVLGHEQCGALAAAVEAVRKGLDASTQALAGRPSLGGVIGRLTPAAREARGEGTVDDDDAAWLQAAVRKNVADVCRQIPEQSPQIKALIDEDRCAIVGAVYDLGGAVEFF